MRAYVRDSEGYRYYGGTLGDDLIFTSKTDFTVASAANTVVAAELAEATDADTSVAIAMAIVPRNGDDTPFDDFDLGDAVQAASIDGVRDSQRTVAIPVAESPLGVVSYGLELNGRIDNDQAVQRRWLDQITPGALSGRADQISSTDLGVGIPFGKLRTSEIVYQQSGELVAELDYTDTEDPGHSDDWPCDEPRLFYRVRWSLAQAGDTDTIVHVRINGGGPFSRSGVPFFHEIIIPAGATAPDDDTNDGLYTNQVATKGDRIRMATYQAGSFARGLVVRLKHTTQT